MRRTRGRRPRGDAPGDRVPAAVARVAIVARSPAKPPASTTPSPGPGGCGPTGWTCTPTTSAACRWRTRRVASSCSAAAPPCTTPRWPPGRSAGSRPCAGSRTRRPRRCWPRYGSRRPCHRARPPPTSGPCTSAARTGAASRRGRCPTSGSSDSPPRPASGTPTPLPSPTSPTVSGSTCWWDVPTSCRPVIPTCSPSRSSGSTGAGVTASRPRPFPTGPHRTRATAAGSGWARSRTPVETSRAPTAWSCCAPRKTTPGAWLRAGEGLSALWLHAVRQGLSVVPLSQVVEVAETRAALRHEVFGGRVEPLLLLRVGWQAISRSHLVATPRRPLDDVLLP